MQRMIKDDRYSKDFGAYMMKETRKQNIWEGIKRVAIGSFIAVGCYLFLVAYMSAFAD